MHLWLEITGVGILNIQKSVNSAISEWNAIFYSHLVLPKIGIGLDFGQH